MPCLSLPVCWLAVLVPDLSITVRQGLPRSRPAICRHLASAGSGIQACRQGSNRLQGPTISSPRKSRGVPFWCADDAGCWLTPLPRCCRCKADSCSPFRAALLTEPPGFPSRAALLSALPGISVQPPISIGADSPLHEVAVAFSTNADAIDALPAVVLERHQPIAIGLTFARRLERQDGEACRFRLLGVIELQRSPRSANTSGIGSRSLPGVPSGSRRSSSRICTHGTLISGAAKASG